MSGASDPTKGTQGKVYKAHDNLFLDQDASYMGMLTF